MWMDNDGTNCEWNIATGGNNGTTTDLEFRPGGTTQALVLKKNGDGVFNGSLYFKQSNAAYNQGIKFGDNTHVIIGSNTGGGLGLYADSSLYLRPGQKDKINTNLGLVISSTDLTYNGKKVWHENNDGSSSGLDADLLDGHHYTDFCLKTDADTKYVKKTGDTMSGTLSIAPSTNAAGIILNKTNYWRFIQFKESDTNKWDVAHGNGDGKGTDLAYRYNGTNKVTFASNGNVGIGTIDPTSKLQVNGDAYVNGPLLVNPGVGNQWDDGIRIVAAKTGYAYVIYGAKNAMTGYDTTGNQ